MLLLCNILVHFCFSLKIRSNDQIRIRIGSLRDELIITQISILKHMYTRIARKSKKLRIRFLGQPYLLYNKEITQKLINYNIYIIEGQDEMTATI